MSADPIEHIESNVRGYARLFPTVFSTAKGSRMVDQQGQRFIDFFCGAGSLNYGHNPDGVKAALLDYIGRDGVLHSLDTVTEAKVRFLESMEQIILKPRGMDFRIQFTGPTGTNAVEAAIKIARKSTGRSHIVAFTHAYHGHSLGSLALTGNQYYHQETYGSHNNVSHLPFDGYVDGLDSAALLRKMIEDQSSGLPKPAAVILETIQGEGGVNVASVAWLQAVESVCRDHGIVLIVDDIQVGNGRTGKFFSFEHAEITPDLVCLSKSIGGGLPLSLLLIRPELDVWQPGEHTGTFRGNNLAFVAAAAVLDHWREPAFEMEVTRRGIIVEDHLREIVESFPSQGFKVRGRGLIWGLDVQDGEKAKRIIQECFRLGVLMESSGADDEVLKVMPALTIERELLVEGLSALTEAVNTVVNAQTLSTSRPPCVEEDHSSCDAVVIHG
ncbi:MAG: diaminobutyrate--2-oxoglutarate transaminase [Planctomycetota bacterium]